MKVVKLFENCNDDVVVVAWNAETTQPEIYIYLKSLTSEQVSDELSGLLITYSIVLARCVAFCRLRSTFLNKISVRERFARVTSHFTCAAHLMFFRRN